MEIDWRQSVAGSGQPGLQHWGGIYFSNSERRGGRVHQQGEVHGLQE